MIAETNIVMGAGSACSIGEPVCTVCVDSSLAFQVFPLRRDERIILGECTVDVQDIFDSTQMPTLDRSIEYTHLSM